MLYAEKISLMTLWQWDWISFVLHLIPLALVMVNLVVSFRKYQTRVILRALLMSLLVLVYYFTGLLSGLMILAGIGLFVLIYFLRWLYRLYFK